MGLGEELDAFLAGTALCGAMTGEVRAAIASHLIPRAVVGGEVLLQEGDPPDGMYFVRAGRLQVRRAGPDGADEVVAEIGRGEVVGEASLVTDLPRVATVVALRDTELLHLSLEAFEQLAVEHPSLLRPITTEVVERLIVARSAVGRSRPITTVAVIPVHDDLTTVTTALRLAEVLQATAGDSAIVESSTWPTDRSEAAWAEELEAHHDLVVYLSDGSSADAHRSLRQADAVLLVADAARHPGPTPVEATLAEHRERIEVPVELVLVHPRHRDLPSGTTRWLDQRDLRRHHHVRMGDEGDLGRVARLVTNRAIGLVLSGGGARGMAEIGVLQAMETLGIPVDAVGGTSAGSMVAGAVARGWPAARVRQVLRTGMVEGRNPVDLTMPVAALAAGRRVTERLKAAAGESDIEDLWLDFFCVSTNLTRTAPHVHRTGAVWRAIRASMSIPGIFPPVSQGDDVLVDGGLVDNLPVGEMRRGHEGITVVAVDVGVQRGVTSGDLPDSTVLDGWRLLVDRLHPRRTSPDVAGILTVLTRLTELGGGGGAEVDRGDVLVVPEVEGFPLLAFDRFDELVDVGERAGRRVLAPWWADGPGGPIIPGG